MKAKLIKIGDTDYILFDNNGYEIGMTKQPRTVKYPLSRKNCQAIERGYDLDEEVWKFAEDNANEDERIGFRIGFQKALEILGDKKFSERQLRKGIAEARACVTDDDTGVKFLKEDADIIQSLQQTEWDVEIEMDSIPADRAPNGWETFPKLDADGCLILKRKL